MADQSRNPKARRESTENQETGAAAGGVGGAIVGGAIGAVAGPAGLLIGALVGAGTGGAAGYAIGAEIDEDAENAYWRDEYRSRPYYDESSDYETTYAPAYRYGWQARSRIHDRSFDETEPDLRRAWEQSEHKNDLSWDKARPATRDAWDRVEAVYIIPDQKTDVRPKG